MEEVFSTWLLAIGAFVPARQTRGAALPLRWRGLRMQLDLVPPRPLASRGAPLSLGPGPY